MKAVRALPARCYAHNAVCEYCRKMSVRLPEHRIWFRYCVKTAKHVAWFSPADPQTF